MKKLGFLIILTALGLFGSAFFGIYTAPGLEEFPTVDSLGLKNKKAKEATATGATKPPPAGVFPSNPNGATAQRNAYLKQNQGNVEGR